MKGGHIIIIIVSLLISQYARLLTAHSKGVVCPAHSKGGRVCPPTQKGMFTQRGVPHSKEAWSVRPLERGVVCTPTLNRWSLYRPPNHVENDER